VSLEPGADFAGFRIVRRLGAGAMGEVYLVEHPRLPRQEALKVLSETYTDNQEYRARFQREAELAASLWHPHLVALHDRGEDDGRLWISMDYIDGSDMARLVRTKYPAGMPVGEALQVITAIASALDYAHGRGMLHRDVKPSNILVSEGPFHEQRIALADFGIARAIDDMAGLTGTNFALGTVEYAPPEQLRGRAIDARADQYALAATAFHLLTGSPPFTGSSPVEVISQHLTDPPPHLGDTRPELTILDGLFAQAMAKDPAARFTSCAEFASRLEAAAAGTPAVGAPAGAAHTTPTSLPQIAPDAPTMAAQAAGSAMPFPMGSPPALPPTMPAHAYNERLHRADTQVAAPAQAPRPTPARPRRRLRNASPAGIALLVAAITLSGLALWGAGMALFGYPGGKLSESAYPDQIVDGFPAALLPNPRWASNSGYLFDCRDSRAKRAAEQWCGDTPKECTSDNPTNWWTLSPAGTHWMQTCFSADQASQLRNACSTRFGDSAKCALELGGGADNQGARSWILVNASACEPPTTLTSCITKQG
jgi:serine/threonine-protein kinase